MSRHPVRSRHARLALASISAVLVALFAATVAQAYVPAPAYSQYDDDIAQANAEKAEQDRRLRDLEHALENTDARIIEANRQLTELNLRLPVVQEEFRIAQERYDAAILQQQIVANKLAAAEAEDRELTTQMADAAERAEELRDTLAQIARTEYQGASRDNSLAIIFGATTSDEFVDDFAFRLTTSRVQSNALAEMEELQAVNRNRKARQDAVREYIIELKRIADALVIETETARKLAEEKKLEVERLLAEAEELKVYLESQREAFLAQQAELEAQQQALLNELAILVEKKREEEADGGGTLGRGYLSWPTAIPYVTSSYGWRIHPIYGVNRFHAGTDFRAYCGTPILAAAGGKVEWTKYRSGFGNQVMMSHGIVGGKVLMTSYNHLQAFNVSSGQNVERGSVIGYSGNTGSSTACHLHFEVYVDGSTVNPISVLP
jgi:murein DD-endopeptidase MepM/ murein hydrolase activator NlpD